MRETRAGRTGSDASRGRRVRHAFDAVSTRGIPDPGDRVKQRRGAVREGDTAAA